MDRERMIINKVIINNFRGFRREKTFDFGGKTFVMLTAPNGKGKTSIIDAIEWCLTGDIKRLHEVYDVRNKNATEKKKNAGAILKNKDGSNEKTTVKIYVSSGDEEYIICREQENDTLDDVGVINVNGQEGKNAEEILSRLIDVDNFYKYHFCDMQKTYRFLSKSRENMDEEFSDFSSDYTEAKTVVDNLELICEDLEKRIAQKKSQKIEDGVIAEKEKMVKKYADAPEILPYENVKLYEDEDTSVSDMTTEQLQEQLRQLYKCGYKRAISLLEKKTANNNVERQKIELQKLKNEFTMHEKDIRQAAEKKVYKEDELKKVQFIFKVYEGIELTTANLEEKCELLFRVKNANFNKEFWQETENRLNNFRKREKELNEDIQVLSKGDKILDILTTLTAQKDELLNYRSIMKQKNPTGIVLCPVCGSERFDKIQEDEITKQAKDYHAEHKDLIETKRRNFNEIKNEENNIWELRLNKANIALDEAINKAKKELDLMTELYNVSREYFSILDNLQKEDSEKFSVSNMLSINNINEAIEFNERKILRQNEKDEIDAEINRIAIALSETTQQVSTEKLLDYFKTKSISAPKVIEYSEEILKKKICSIKSFLNNEEYLKAVKELKDINEKNNEIQKDIEDYTTYKKKILERIKNINAQIDKMKKEEIDQVGPYLYKLFCKLSRDVQIDKIQTLKMNADKTDLLDEKNKPLMNMFSDGQLSVFMISYFFGNIFRMQEKEMFPVYFIDDITSCMDDINMLAFLDLIKYQLINVDKVMNQIFFATCNEKIQDLIEYKFGNCGIEYKKIGMELFIK